jgi:hypothetical protein
VSLQVWRTNYKSHLKAIYPHAKQAGSNYYKNAIKWMKTKVNAPLMFIVFTDDVPWSVRHVVGRTKDVYMLGEYTFIKTAGSLKRFSYQTKIYQRAIIGKF